MSDNEKEESPINVDLEVDELDEKEEKLKSEEPETENGNGVPRKRARSEDDGSVKGENGNGNNNGNSNPNEDDEKEEDDDEDAGEEDADGEGEDNEEEEDEDDEDEDEEGGGHRRPKKRRKAPRVNRFLDVEAEVDDEDEEEDDVDYEGDVAGFIDEVPETGAPTDEHRHRQLNRDFGRNEEMDVREIVRGIKERHGRSSAAKYDADSDNIPQRLLMPSADDPSLWRVRVKSGREQIIIATIFQKMDQLRNQANALQVHSAFFRDSLAGSIFLEAQSAGQVTQAIHGIMGVFMGTPPALVPIEEMAPLLKIKKKDVQLSYGMWVRFKRGKHTGDLAQVVDVDQITSGIAGIKFLPRIDLTPKEKRRDRLTGKSLGASVRPPARPFQIDEIRKIYGRGAAKQGAGAGAVIFDNDEYINGFCFKDFKVNFLQTEDIKPTLEEISLFTADEDDSKLDLSAIMDANKMTTASGLVPGDRVEVHEGEQTGLYGSVETVTSEIVAIKAEGGDVHGQTIEVPSRSVRKRFEVGEHVTVINGKNTETSGMVVEVQGDVITLMSDQGEREIKVFSRDIRKAGDSATITAKTGLYDLHDLVMLDSTTSGVVIKIEGALLRILDQNGISRMVSPNQVTARREAKNYAVGSDSQGNEFRVGDFMKETSGENRQGEVINIFRSLFVFLHNRDLTENNGVFVARSTSLISVTPKSTNDLGKINPALNQALPFGGASLMPPPATSLNKNRIVNTLVVVTKGSNKGLMGVIKDLQGDNARVELATNNKILTINLSSLKRKDPKTGQTYPLDTGMGPPSMGMSGGRPPMGGYDMNPYAPAPVNGGATPAWSGAGGSGGRTPAGRFGQTPNPYAGGGGGGGFGGGKTPNPYAAGGRTPAPSFGGGGGKTPGWAGGGGMGGKTPAYGGGGDGGKTPGWGAAAGAGGRTPGWAGGAAGGGGRTPNPYGAPPQVDASSSRQPYSAPTPQPQPPTGMPARPVNPYGAPTPQPYGGPTPYTAPTPWGAPTPAVSAPTPSGVAPTPGAFGGPTPYSAPTPYGAAATPFGAVPTGPPTHIPSANGLSYDWAMDFWNIVIEVGPSSKPNTKAPRHHQRGAHDGRRFGLQNHLDDDILEVCAVDDQSVVERIPAEYARPVRPDGPGQVCVAVLGDNKGAQRTTQYENDGQWMMEQEPEDVAPLVVDTAGLCKIWRSAT